MFVNTISFNAIPNQARTRIVLKELYRPCVETAIPTSKILDFPADSTFSPSLSEIEIADIRLAEREFAQEEAEIFNDAESFIQSLHVLRRQHQENRE